MMLPLTRHELASPRIACACAVSSGQAAQFRHTTMHGLPGCRPDRMPDCMLQSASNQEHHPASPLRCVCAHEVKKQLQTTFVTM